MPEATHSHPAFPDYTRAERRADTVVHVLSVGGALAGVGYIAVILGDLAWRPAVSLAVYGLSLLLTLSLSAAYNLAVRPGRKEILRRFDHAAIFVLIAGSYTPLGVVIVGGATGTTLAIAVWGLAVIGIALKLLFPRRFEKTAILLYLLQGWLLLFAANSVLAAMADDVLILIAIGALLYTLGVGFHIMSRLPFHNAIWHAFVLAAAACHYAAFVDAAVPAP